ncbi:MAG: hypothetical protein HOV87_27260 [Catenulispora sp.]|nr:hypothetical protein [Catenulispora sp.]
MPSANFPGIESIVDDIAKCELDYRDRVEDALRDAELSQREEELLERLDSYLPTLVYAFDSQVPPPRERGGNLALVKEYYEWEDTSGDADARRHAAIRSYLATETERRGQFNLNRAQNARIAAHFDAMGREFLDLGLPRHAAMAYQNAADMYLPLQERTKRERSLLNRRRAQHRTRPPGLTRIWEAVFDAVCGYSYKPFRMLGWMAAVLMLFSLAVWACGPSGLDRSVHGCLINFLNPLAFRDLDPNFGAAAQVLLVLESYLGSVSMAIFFALLVRD